MARSEDDRTGLAGLGSIEACPPFLSSWRVQPRLAKPMCEAEVWGLIGVHDEGDGAQAVGHKEATRREKDSSAAHANTVGTSHPTPADGCPVVGVCVVRQRPARALAPCRPTEPRQPCTEGQREGSSLTSTSPTPHPRSHGTSVPRCRQE